MSMQSPFGPKISLVKINLGIVRKLQDDAVSIWQDDDVNNKYEINDFTSRGHAWTVPKSAKIELGA